MKLGGETILINIKYCRNYSWQGTMKWLDGQKSYMFRSALEMVMLINNITGGEFESNEESIAEVMECSES